MTTADSVRPAASPPPLTAIFREDISLDALRQLHGEFEEHGEFSEEEFVVLLRRVIGPRVTDVAALNLFMRIDANSDGAVSWEEFSNYMFMGGSSSGGTDDSEWTHFKCARASRGHRRA